VFELLETVKRLTETNMAAGNLKDPIGNTRISFFCCLKENPKIILILNKEKQAAALQHFLETNIIVVSSKKELTGTFISN
jgi:hypothetical protein